MFGAANAITSGNAVFGRYFVPWYGSPAVVRCIALLFYSPCLTRPLLSIGCKKSYCTLNLCIHAFVDCNGYSSVDHSTAGLGTMDVTYSSRITDCLQMSGGAVVVLASYRPVQSRACHCFPLSFGISLLSCSKRFCAFLFLILGGSGSDETAFRQKLSSSFAVVVLLYLL